MFGPVMQADGIAQVATDVVGQLLGRDEEVGRAIGVNDRVGERDGRVIDLLDPRLLLICLLIFASVIHV